MLREKNPEMLHLLQFPYNGEPPKRLVTAKAITPNDLHFIRNHGGIPLIDEDKFTLDIDGLVHAPRSFTMSELMDESVFPRVRKTITMQCSGTRRIEQIGLYAGQGDEVPQAPWAEGAIGTAEYVGVSLKKVIKACGGLKHPGKHLEFYGADTYVKNLEVMNYVVSVPWGKVRANEVLLCWEMNGERLPAIHGFPLRVMVPGYSKSFARALWSCVRCVLDGCDGEALGARIVRPRRLGWRSLAGAGRQHIDAFSLPFTSSECSY